MNGFHPILNPLIDIRTMVDPQLFLLFIFSSLLLLYSPGPAVLYILSKSIEQGKKAGFASIFGIAIGNAIHALAATFGLTLLIAESIFWFTVVKLVGAAYLIYLGVQSIKKEVSFEFQQQGGKPAQLQKVLIDGAIVNTFNPKTALFFLAFVPQFLNLGYGQIPKQTLFYGITFTLLALGSDSIFVLISVRLKHFLQRSQSFQNYQKYIVGGIYIVLGLITFFSSAK